MIYKINRYLKKFLKILYIIIKNPHLKHALNYSYLLFIDLWVCCLSII